MRNITLTQAASRYVINRYDGLRVRITAEHAVNMPTSVFAYRMVPANPQTGEQSGTFSHVCSPVDLAEWPENAPAPNFRPQWFRLPYVDLLLRSRTEADDVIAKIYEDVDSLKLSLDIQDVFDGSPVTTVIGDPSPPVLPSSSHSSVSSHSSPSQSLGPIHSVRALATTVLQAGLGGAPWIQIGEGAASPIGSSDSSSGSSLAASYSRVYLHSGQSSNLLLLRGYPFGCLPLNAQIVGIRADMAIRDTVAADDSSPSAGAHLVLFQLATASGLLGVNQGDNGLIPGPMFATVPAGSNDDTWGFTPTRLLVAGGDFGVGVLVRLDADAEPTFVDVDGCELTIYFVD